MKIKLTKAKHTTPFESVIQKLHFREVREDDYFKRLKFCILGAKKPIQNYENNAISISELIGYEINYNRHTNISIIAGAGMGKTKLTKQIISHHYKQGYKILIFCPKNDEYSNASKMGKGKRLHKEMKNQSLPIVSYCPSFVKHYLEMKKLSLVNYKFYTHSITNFTNREIWQSLNLSSTASSFAVGCINNGVNKIKELQRKFKSSNLQSITRNSAIEKLNNIMEEKFLNDKMKELNLEEEWSAGNIISINYHSHKGFLMSTDVYLIVEKIREYCSKNNRNGIISPVLIIFEDANYYAETKPYNIFSINAINMCQINYRSLGVNLIVGYQNPESVDDSIIKGSTTHIVSYIANPNSLNGVLPEDAIYKIKARENSGGLVIDNAKTYTVQWIYKPEGREWWAFFPFDCFVGH